jgi:hypothetical protein
MSWEIYRAIDDLESWLVVQLIDEQAVIDPDLLERGLRASKAPLPIRQLAIERLQDFVNGRELVPLADALLAMFPDEFVERPLPAEPTDEMPGSPAKIELFAARRAAGILLHHPGDRKSVADDAGLELIANSYNGMAIKKLSRTVRLRRVA